MFWKPLTPILKTIAEAQSQVTSQCRKISKSSLASHGSIILDPADGQKLNPIFPQLGHGYYTPEYNVDRFTRIVATIENTRWRFWADFGTQLLLLSIGALLGGTTFRVGGATEH
jgi:hypothetical protein